jgi:hypothetical protein
MAHLRPLLMAAIVLASSSTVLRADEPAIGHWLWSTARAVQTDSADPIPKSANLGVSPDRKTRYSVGVSDNLLLADDLSKVTGDGQVSRRKLGPLVADATATHCKAISVAPDGTVWIGLRASFSDQRSFLHLVSWKPGDDAPTDHGRVAVGRFEDAAGNKSPADPTFDFLHAGASSPALEISGITAHSSDSVSLTTPDPLTVHTVRIPRVAGVTTIFRHNSHADVILGRTFLTDSLDGQGEQVQLKLVSAYVDQTPASDISQKWADQFGFKKTETIREALTLGTGKLAVDGVVMVAEHGDYPKSPTEQTEYPKRRLFTEIAEVIRESGRSIPVFSDKHLSDNWEDAKWFYDTARELKIPLMAGSSLPVAWREPPTDVKQGAKLKQIVGVSYGRLDAYGFHGVEMLQCLAERRAGGESGVKQVQCFTGDAVWQAGEDGIYDQQLLEETLSRLTIRRWEARKKTVREVVKEPVLFVTDYRDGLRTCLFTLNGAVAEWAAAWKYADDDSTDATLFKLQEDRPFGHFSLLLMGVEKMMHTGQPAWPVERTLLTTGILDAALTSRLKNAEPLPTPWLDVKYHSEWNWRQPPPPPEGRSIRGE